MLVLRSSSAASTRSPGAGRILDLTWPGVITPVIFGTDLGTPGAISRLGPLPAGNTSARTLTGAGRAYYWYTGGLGGMPIIAFDPTGNPASDILYRIDNFSMSPNLMNPGQGIAGWPDAFDDWQCFRCIACISFGTSPDYLSDCGMQWNSGNRVTGVKGSGGGDGFGFTQTADSVVSFIYKSGFGPAVTFPVLTANLDRFNAYEIRLIGGTATTKATLKVFVNGVLVRSIIWTEDPNLPFLTGTNAFATTLQSANGGGISILPRLRFMVAPTEAALL